MMSLDNTERVGVSVVLCCYNSSSRIVPTLVHLSKQENLSLEWEVLLIDNNSTDGTAEIAQSTWQDTGSVTELRIIKETRPGTMFARQRGIVESIYRYILFCDDDNWFHPHYVKLAFEKIRLDGSIAAVGGWGEIEFEPGFTAPAWLRKFQKSFGAGPQGKMDGDITTKKGCLYTAGAILDRVWLSKLYASGFSSFLRGRDGKSLVAGEDTELTYALRLIGGRLYYSSELTFKHFMPAGRLQWSYLIRLWNAFGRSDFVLLPYKEAFGKWKVRTFYSLIALHLGLTVKWWLFAALSRFAEGNFYVLKYSRSRGQLSALMNNYSMFLANRVQVNKLQGLSRSKS